MGIDKRYWVFGLWIIPEKILKKLKFEHFTSGIAT